MKGNYTFANTSAGRELSSCTETRLIGEGFAVRRFEEEMVVGKNKFVLLKLEVTGKRKGEGEIAADMKQRKTVRQFIEEQ